MNNQKHISSSCDKEEFLKENIVRIKRVTWLGIIVNLLLSVLKFIGGILGSSQAVIADAVHSLSDITTDLAVLFGVKYWSAPADKIASQT